MLQKAPCKTANSMPQKIVQESGKPWLVCKAGPKKAPPKKPTKKPTSGGGGGGGATTEPPAPDGTTAAANATTAPSNTTTTTEASATDVYKEECLATDTFKDKKGLCFPSFCANLPPPEYHVFSTMTIPFPCHFLTSSWFIMAKKRQNSEDTTPARCAWDYVVGVTIECAFV